MKVGQWIIVGLIMAALIFNLCQGCSLGGPVSEQSAATAEIQRKQDEFTKTVSEYNEILAEIQQQQDALGKEIKESDSKREEMESNVLNALYGSGVRLEAVFDGYDLEPNEWTNEVYGLVPYHGKLYLQNIDCNIYSFDPRTREVITYPLPTGMTTGSAALIFKDKLYYGGMSTSYEPTIYGFDGKEWTVKYKGPPGGLWVNSFGVFEDKAYAGGYNKILSSSNGETWTEDFNFATNKSIGGFLAVGGSFYAVEGEGLTGQSRIYRKSGGIWSLARIVDIATMYIEAGKFSNCILGSKGYIGSIGSPTTGAGKLFQWDGTKILTLMERGQSIQGLITQAGMTCCRLESLIFITTFAGSGQFSRGQLWLWDGARLLKLLELPYHIFCPQYFDGRVYLLAFTTAMGELTSELERSMRWGEQNKGILISLPWDIIQNGKIEPRIVRVWLDKSTSAGTTYASDDDGGVVIPCFGYGKKTIYVNDSRAAILNIEGDLDGNGSWEMLETGISLTAGSLYKIVLDEGVVFLRLKVTQGIDDGILNARVVLE